ncbi:MAG: 2-oxo acid dehydrogenase subunit E2, partial [Micromonosporaceae bacterium]
MSTQSNSKPNSEVLADFGPNEWIVEDMYQRYLNDPSSVDPAWHDFFADYKPTGAGDGRSGQPAGAGDAASDKAPAATSNKGTVGARTTTPSKPAPKPAAAAPPATKTDGKPAAKQPASGAAGGKQTTIRGVGAKIAANMDASLSLPTATSVRAVPAKLIADNRIVINNHLTRGRGGKVSFTHLIGYAMVKALVEYPEMNASFQVVDGKPTLHQPDHVNLGIAIDTKREDGTRMLVVPSVKAAEQMDFREFWQAYEEIVRRARRNELTLQDHTGATVSLTNPGTIGTVHSVPRLMQGQGTIIGVGAMEYPAEFAGMSEDSMAKLGVSKIMTLTSTYDHRIIQGAQSGEYLRRVHQLLLGEDGFYDQIFTSLRIPYEPVRWVRDVAHMSEGQISKGARLIELIHSYRVRGHLMADTDPLEFEIRRHPDLDILEHGLTLWDLDR